MRVRGRELTWAVPLAAATASVATGLLPLDDARKSALAVAPVLVFLVAVTALAGLADDAGVFAAAARQAARAAGGRTPVLYGLVVLLAWGTTVLLGLDTTAVLLTPVVLALAQAAELPVLPFALVTVWLANTGSLLLPVSNLTNLLAADRLDVPLHTYVLAFAPASVVAVLGTVAVALAFDGRALRGRYALPAGVPVADRLLFRGAVVVLLLLAALLGAGADPAAAAVVAVVPLLGLWAWRRPRALSVDLVPWRLVPLVLGVLLLAAAAGPHGLDALLRGLLGPHPGALRLAAAGALLSNGVDNLPAFVALARVVPDDALPGMLLGVDAGPLVLPWASLATLLWADRCRAAGVVVPWGTFGRRGLVLVPVLLLASAPLLPAGLPG